MNHSADIRFIRRWIAFFMIALLISGLTAVPLEWGAKMLALVLRDEGGPWQAWAERVARAVSEVGQEHGFLFYGTDWLAFAHVVIAMAFIGPYRNPVRNKWVVDWGLWSCLLVLPFAFFWAPVRGIPFFWRCIDASFGVFGAVPLWLVRSRIGRMERNIATGGA
ncbi:MAG: hypothetical protein KDC00_14975 [Flavobacteriales bacterium]|nr:hypothetical protein [Flavobacteriales bacterium]